MNNINNMNKKDFLDCLYSRLQSITPEERQESLDYYSEIIDDMVEEGMSEEAAVQELGSIEDIVKSIMSEIPHKDNVHKDDVHRKSKFFGMLDYEEKIYKYNVSNINRLTVNDKSCKVIVTGGGEGVEIKCWESNNNRYNVNISDDMSITIINEITGILKCNDSDLPLFITLPKNIGSADITTLSGDVSVSDIEISELLEISTKSGDIKTENSNAGRLNIRTMNGDINEYNCFVNNGAAISSTNGDLKIEKVNLLSLDTNTINGDVRVNSVKISGNLNAGSVNGDIKVENTFADSGLNIHTVNGDIHLLKFVGKDIKLETVSGDICGSIIASENEYNIETQTVRGSIRVPSSFGGSKLMRLKTVNGDIKINFTK